MPPCGMQPTHWHHYEQRWPDPDPVTALRAPVCAFPSWFFFAACDRCRRETHLSQVDFLVARQGDRLVSEIVSRLRCQRFGQAPDRVELVTGLRCTVTRSDGSR